MAPDFGPKARVPDVRGDAAGGGGDEGGVVGRVDIVGGGMVKIWLREGEGEDEGAVAVERGRAGSGVEEVVEEGCRE